MLLNKSDLEALRAQPAQPCATCHASARPDYCRSCDDFFFRCTNRCPDEHAGHRTYWNVLIGKTMIDPFGIELPLAPEEPEWVHDDRIPPLPAGESDFHRNVVKSEMSEDGWRDETLSCGHVVSVIAAISPERTRAFCDQCVSDVGNAAEKTASDLRKKVEKK